MAIGQARVAASGIIGNRPALTFPTGIPFCRIDLDVSGTSIRVLARGDMARECANFSKGDHLDVEGEIKIHEWEATPGKARQTFHVEAESASRRTPEGSLVR